MKKTAIKSTALARLISKSDIRREEEKNTEKLNLEPKRKYKLLPEDSIEIYDKVKLLNINKQLIREIRLVPEETENYFEGKISINSELGSTVIQNKIQSVIFVNEGKEVVKYKILSATRMV